MGEFGSALYFPAGLTEEILPIVCKDMEIKA